MAFFEKGRLVVRASEHWDIIKAKESLADCVEGILGGMIDNQVLLKSLTQKEISLVIIVKIIVLCIVCTTWIQATFSIVITTIIINICSMYGKSNIV